MWQGGASLLHHIVFNSTSLDCARKFEDFKGSAWAVRRLSDQICLEHGLSVIENPQPRRGRHYGRWLGEDRKPSFRERLRQAIDAVLEQKPVDFDTFLTLLQEAEVEVKRRGDTLSLRMKTFNAQGKKQNGFIRFRSLPEDYTESVIRERIEGKRTVHKTRAAVPAPAKKVSLLIDIQNSIKA